ncbi:hypothetical protein [Microbacterium sp. NPDC058389]|uniref:hypothetical protein n=1 Tax=Microbacterium sp. NPDC058389 TaxID=3346475 RepID=UPI00364E0CA2
MGKADNVVVEAAPRRARESFAELGAFVALLALPAAFLVLWVAAGADWVRWWELAIQAGSAVLAEIGWVFGVYVPTLLGFYVLVLGEQLGHAVDAGRLRRLLGGVAEISFAALVPALLLIVLSCLSEPANIGPLLVIGPATLLLLFLTVQLGGFVVFDVSVQLDDAVKTRQKAKVRMQALQPRSRRPVWLVLAANGVGTVTVGCLAIAAAGAAPWLTQWQTYVVVGAGALLMCGLGAFGATMVVAGTRLGQWAAIALLILMWAAVTVIAWGVRGHVLNPVVLAYGAMAAAATLSAYWPRQHAARRLVDWTLVGAVTTVAARNEARAHRASVIRIAELRSLLGPEKGPPLVQRLWGALRA